MALMQRYTSGFLEKKNHQKLIFIMHINKGLDHYQLKNLGLHQIFLNLTRESGFNLRLLLTK